MTEQFDVIVMNLRKFIFVMLVIISLPGMVAAAPTSDTVANWKRVDDVHAIATMVEQFHQKNGYYPLWNPAPSSPDPVLGRATSPCKLNDSAAGQCPLTKTVLIAPCNFKQAFTMPPRGVSGAVIPAHIFYGVLKDSLGNIALLADPDRVPKTRPNYYQYAVNDQGYSVKAYLSAPVVVARKISDKNFAFAIGRGLPEVNLLYNSAQPKEWKPSVKAAREAYKNFSVNPADYCRATHYFSDSYPKK